MLLISKYILVFLLLFAPSAEAHPPSEIEMKYNQEQSLLELSMRHITRNFNHHYIRRLVIFKNDEEVKAVANHKQTNQKTFTKTIPLEAEPDDTILVKIYCSDGGVATGKLVVEAEETEDAGK